MKYSHLKKQDTEIYKIIKDEEKRQSEMLSMIASENFTSPAIREAVGSIMMNKYSEGFPEKRYYEGNENIDALEKITIKRVKKLFNLPSNWGVIVQALSGSPANLATYLGLLNIGDKIMGMYLPDGGHLSHGWSYSPSGDNQEDYIYKGGERRVNITSKIFKTIQYKTDPKTKIFNYDKIQEIAEKEKPNLIITGGTAYPREIDYKRMAKIAKSVGAYYLADIAHEAGLVATGTNKSPVGIADVVTFTTHKTLRCNRGAIIIGKDDLIKKIERAIFPGLQGGPHNHSIAGIAVGLLEAQQPEFKKYTDQIVRNAKELGKQLQKFNFDIVSEGTDKHLILVDLTNKGLFGKKYAKALSIAGIVTNMNTMPGETRSPANPSAIRIGTPWITTRGMKEKEMNIIASFFNKVMNIVQDDEELKFKDFVKKYKSNKNLLQIKKEVLNLTNKFPLDI